MFASEPSISASQLRLPEIFRPVDGDLLWPSKGPFVHKYVMSKANSPRDVGFEPFGDR